jgi:hypothetical protein
MHLGYASALAACALSLALAPAARAQSFVRAGQTVSGRLEASDPALDDGSHYDVWSYRGRAGERLVVTLRSDDFDAYLAVGRLSGGDCEDDCETDDDGAGGTDARVVLTLREDGVYGIRANSLDEGETGAYTLTVESGEAPPLRPAGAIGVGETASGRLDTGDLRDEDDDSYYELWTYRGPAGLPVVITLRSGEFDAYLSWGRLEGGEWEEIDTDDDGAGGTDARLTVTPEPGETYFIRANSLSEGETGSYALTVEPGGGDGHDGQVESDPAPDLSGARPVRAGEAASGSLVAGDDPMLGDGTYYDAWIYQGRAGERLEIVLRSDEFDTFVTVGRVSGEAFEELGAADDGADGTNSRLEVTLPADGAYVILANSLTEGETGAYTLTVRSTR